MEIPSAIDRIPSLGPIADSQPDFVPEPDFLADGPDTAEADLAPDVLAGAPVTDIEVLEVAPKKLIIGANARRDVVLDPDFVRSIGRRGVREPIRVYRDGNGALVVHDGQRRTLAALRKKLELVRVIVEPRPEADESDLERSRIVDQVVVNRHRLDITSADQVGATQQLLELGLDARAIARECSIPIKEVETTVRVAKSDLARKALDEGALDLTQAAVVAEFADDDEAVASLTEYAAQRPEQFDHAAQRLRDRREETRLRQEATDKLTAEGVTVVDRPDNLSFGKARRLTDLRTAPNTKPGVKISPTRHESCSGHAVFLDYHGWKPVDERVIIVHICTDFAGHGHAERNALAGKTTFSSSTTSRVSGPMSDEEKAARRTVIKNGKDWDSAVKVRAKWLKTFGARKTAPKDAASWIAQMWAEGGTDLRKAMEADHELAATLLNIKPKTGRTRYNRKLTHPIADAAAKATPGRATMINLILLLAALEAGTDRRRTWDTPTAAQVAYLTKLKSWGYALSPVEELVVASRDTAVTTPATTATAETAESDSEDDSEDDCEKSEEADTLAEPTSIGDEEPAGQGEPTSGTAESVGDVLTGTGHDVDLAA
ncbi:ParB/Srx family N-terminal domain-containing protein [Amycolatopsis thailandensis]